MVKINYKLYIIILISVFFSSCIIYATGIFDQKLKLEKQVYLGKELRLDGFYYNEYYSEHYKIVFLYSNGIFIYYSAGYSYNEILNSDSLVFNLYPKEPMFKYGLFQIKDSTIKIEKWSYSSGGPTTAYLREGKILNDTTFVLYNNSTEGEIDTVGTIYHFKQFNPKPDSTNRFIK